MTRLYQFLIDWLDVVRSKTAVTTYASYVSNVEKSIIPFFDSKQLTLKQLEHTPFQNYFLLKIILHCGWKSNVLQEMALLLKNIKE